MKLSKSVVILSLVVMAAVNISAVLILKVIPGGQSCEYSQLITDCAQNGDKVSCAYANARGLVSRSIPAYCETLRFIVFFTTVTCMLVGVVSGFVLVFSNVIDNKKTSQKKSENDTQIILPMAIANSETNVAVNLTTNEQ